MKKPTLKRLSLGILQHTFAAVMLLLIVMIILNVRIRVESMYGTYSYDMNPFAKEECFEDSEVFKYMFRQAISDITTLVVIKGQLETEGNFDPHKLIDCTAFANRKGKVSECPVTVSYPLENLIKWGQNGIEMSEWSMSKREFVTYFGEDILNKENFYLDENNRLQFVGYPSQEEHELAEQEVLLQQWYEIYSINDGEELVNLVFEYLTQHIDKHFDLIEDENGEEIVQFQMLKCRYSTSNGHSSITEAVDNWQDYCMLENNVINTIDSIDYNYNQYQNHNDIYAENNSNLRYLFKIGKGANVKIYTNLAENFNTKDNKIITDYFSNMNRYLMYNLEDMSYKGNVEISRGELYSVLSTYEYAYPEETYVWMGIDTSYRVEDDQFALAKKTYDRVMPHIGQMVCAILILAIGWMILWNYLSYTAGRATDEEGNPTHYLNWFDKLHTEFVLLIGCVLGYIGLWGMVILNEIIMEEGSYYILGNVTIYGENSARMYIYGYVIVYGFMSSMTFSAMWYSLIRRIKGKNLWKNSSMHWFFSKVYDGFSMVMYHRSVMLRTLLPYNLFLFLNLVGLMLAYLLRNSRQIPFLPLFVLLGLLVFDALTGVYLFRRNAEMKEIVDGINRIRQGEVDYQLDTEKLHGENLEMAKAVNHIGEGIRHAVATSMKDERMKTDLITNVSHDIKTPLTSIINYVDLLKRENIEQEPAKSYIGILEAKANRLKQLIEDLVEVSRISSGNIVLEKVKLDFSELLNQGIGEFSEKFQERDLMLVFTDAAAPTYIYADGRRMWRVIENLFHNICKYAMPNTRVYIDMQLGDGTIEASIKNISERQLNISPEELTERFIRGDVARTTEGSGLGLSITQHLIEAQGGSFQIYLDGDLFKAVIRFPVYQEPESDLQEEGAEEAGQQELVLPESIEPEAVLQETIQTRTSEETKE